MSRSYRAVFARGGTSKALLFRIDDLPSREQWDEIFLAAMGSPDPHARQLDGMGGGVSSLSKVCVVGPPTRDDADVDYTFAQVQIRESFVDYGGNCGNMLSAVAPFALSEGLIDLPDGPATVRVHNTNTNTIIEASFVVEEGRAVESGGTSIPGVSGTGAPVELSFVRPGGAITGRTLPAGSAMSLLTAGDGQVVEASLVDVATACVFVSASDLALLGTELPDTIESTPGLLQRLAALRNAGSVAMGIAGDVTAAQRSRLVPLIAVVSAPSAYLTMSGERIDAASHDLAVRVISNGQAHRALPVTGGLCLAAAARIEGTVPSRLSRPTERAIRIATPSGVIEFDARLASGGNPIDVERGSIVRTTRQLFRGEVQIR